MCLRESSGLAKILSHPHFVLHSFVLGRGKPFLCQVWVLWEEKKKHPLCAWVCMCACRIITGIQSPLGNDTNCPDPVDACDAARSLSLLPYPLQGFLKCSIWILVSGKDPALGPIWQMRSCAASAPADWASLSQSLSLSLSTSQQLLLWDKLQLSVIEEVPFAHQ